MSLKDFSFAQLNRSASLKVGKSKADEKANMGRGMCSTARSCTHR